MKTKRVAGITNDEYHNDKKWKDYISSSKVKGIDKNGIYAYLEKPRMVAGHLDLGSAAHLYFFEYDEYYKYVHVIQESKIDGRTTDGKAQAKSVRELKENYDIVLWRSEHEGVMQMWHNFKTAYPELAKMCRENQHNSEISFFAEDWRGRKAKVRTDHIGDTKYGVTILDLKTCFDDLSERIFVREVAKYGYDIQDCMYKEVAEADCFLFIMVKTSPPYTVQVFRITNDFKLEAASLKIRYSLDMLDEYEKNPKALLPVYKGGIIGV